MKEKYWDEIEMSNLRKLQSEDPYSTKVCLEEYLRDYPSDYSAFYFYIDILIILKEYDEALKTIKNVKKMYLSDKKITEKKIKEVFELLEEKALIRYYLATHQYDYALDYLEYNKSIKTHIELELKLYCYKKLGIKTNSSSTTYGCLQILDYNEERMINEIRNRMNSMITSPDFPDKRRFKNDFPLEDVIKIVKENLREENKLCYGYIADTYVFKYDCCGRVDEKLQDFFKVSCYHDTNDILLMYPANKCEKLPYIDINYIKEEPKIKRLSQVEKFNRRYQK